MDMQDKEFDELFRSKLDNLEVNPSEQVWANISGELHGRTRKLNLVPFLSIAASVIVFVTAGVLFIPEKVKTTYGPKVKSQIASVLKPVNNIAKPKNNAAATSVAPAKVASQQIAVVTNPVTQSHRITVHERAVVKHSAPVSEPSRPLATVNNNNQPQLAAVSEKQESATSAMVPGNETPIAIKLPDAAVNSTIADSPKLAEQLPVTDKPETAPVKRKRIRTLGDLINVVVAKVDKRKDKVIEFTNNDDDDESNITGVNLGIIKVKK